MNRRTRFLQHAWVLLLVLIIGCTPKNDRELLGSYVAKLPAGEETLDLLADGACHQEIRLTDGKRFSARGHWDFDPKKSRLSLTGTRVSMNGFAEMNPTIAEIPAGGTGSLPVSRGLFGGIEIGTDEGILYRKTKE
jgi:hypothetical protein